MEIWERLLLRSKRVGDCLEWQGAKAHNGYGFIKIRGIQRRVHRTAYELWIGTIPDGMIIMHTCDNPPCLEPKHLKLGTMKDNHEDRERKGRGRRLKGEDNPDSKLTAVQVTEIRKRYAQGDISQKALGDEFGVNQALIWGIVKRTKWAHVP